jgi:DNA-binding response OmpR family regulator
MLDTHGGTESMTTEPVNVLQGARVLLLEDETLVSMMVEDMLADLGCEIVGPFARLDLAMSFVADNPAVDPALLDVNLGGVRSFPMAEALADKGVPFVFTTGYDESGMPDEWRDRPSLRKPFMMHEMAAVLKKAITRDA